MSRIIIAGAGHGGIVAAIKLAAAGHDVTVFEKEDKNSVGLPQSDSVSEEAFKYADIPLPDGFKRAKNRLTFIPLGDDTPPLTLPEPAEETIIADRKELINYLLFLAENGGVKTEYGVEVTGPIMLGSRVAGIKTSVGEFYADIIIDACGVNSPIRKALPQFTEVNREIKKFDTLYTYRAYFEKDETAPQPETDYNLYIKDNGTEGFSWAVNCDGKVDVLIGRFSPITTDTLLRKLLYLDEENPQMSKKFLGGTYGEIPVCQPLAVLVADGYAAVGDSAFMTYAVKGSGIEYAMKAGTMLADAVNTDTLGLFTAETLWDYERRFFREIGFSACRIALIKNILPYITAKDLDDAFKSGLATTEELSEITANKLDSLFSAKGISLIKDKIKLIRENPVLTEVLTDFLKSVGKLTVTETYFPNKYNRKDVAKWAEKYNTFFENIRRKEEHEELTNN